MSRPKGAPNKIVGALPGEWVEHALCRMYPHVPFFPPHGLERGGQGWDADAKAICGSCRVRAECLAWALEHDEQGVWGGTSVADRKRIREERRRVS